MAPPIALGLGLGLTRGGASAADLLAAYRSTALFVLDPALSTITEASGVITAATDALGTGVTLTGPGGGVGLTRDSADGQAAIVSPANAMAYLTTTGAGPASGAAHTIHWTGTVQTSSDLGIVGFVGRRDAAGSFLGTRSSRNGWWGSFTVGAQGGTVGTYALDTPVSLSVIYSAEGYARMMRDGAYDGVGFAVNSWSVGMGIATAGGAGYPLPAARCRRLTIAGDLGTFFAARNTIAAWVRAELAAGKLTTTVGQFCAVGDSITYGYGLATPATEAWPAVAAAAIGGGISFVNRGISGTYASDNAAPVVNGVSLNPIGSACAYMLPRARGSVTTIGWGTNDMARGDSAATVIANLLGAASTFAATGGRPVMQTILPRYFGDASDAPFEAKRATVNAAIRASGYTVLDWDTLPHASPASSTTYYQDGTHPKAALAAEMGAHAATVIAPLIT